MVVTFVFFDEVNFFTDYLDHFLMCHLLFHQWMDRLGH